MHWSSRFPDVHAEAATAIDFQRTLRIPDDGKALSAAGRPRPLSACGTSMTSHERVPAGWIEHGGVMMPMYQAEAIWISFSGGGCRRGYPFAIKIATGKINAVSGKPWKPDSTPPSATTSWCPSSPGSTASAWPRTWSASSWPCRWAGLHGRGANHRQGRARRVADHRLPDEDGARRAAPCAEREDAATPMQFFDAAARRARLYAHTRRASSDGPGAGRAHAAADLRRPLWDRRLGPVGACSRCFVTLLDATHGTRSPARLPAHAAADGRRLYQDRPAVVRLLRGRPGDAGRAPRS